MDVFNLLARISLDSSEYVDDLNDAEEKTSKFGTGLKNGLSTATKIGAGAIVALGTTVVAGTKTLIDGTKATAEYGDTIDKQSQKIGLSAEAYQEWDFILQHSGSSVDALTAVMKTMNANVESGSEAFEQLGISQEELANLSTEELLKRTITALQGVEDETTRNALASDTLGKKYMELNPLLNTSAEETEAMRQQVHELGGVMSDESVKASAGFQDSLKNAQVSVSGLKNSLMSELLPSFTDVLDGFSALVSGTDESGEQFSKGIENAIDAVVDLLPKMLDVGGKLVVSLINGIVDNLPKIVGTAKDLLDSLIEGILNNLPLIIGMLPEVLSTAMDLIFDVIDGILEALPDLVLMLAETLPELIRIFISKIIENLPRIIEGLVKVVLAISEALPQIIMSIIDMLPTLIRQLIDALITSLPILIQGAIQLVLGLVQHLPEIIMGFIQALPDIIDAIIDGLMDAIPQIFSGLITLTIEITKHLPEIIMGLIQAIPDIGRSIVEGLWEGISSMATWIWDNIKGFFGGIWDGIKSIFEVHSPSKKFAWLGRMNVEGMAEGFDDYGDEAIDSAIDMAKGINKAVEGTLSADTFAIPDITTTQNYQVSTASISDTGEFNMLVDAFKIAFKDMKIELDGDEMGGFVDRTMTRLVYS